MGKPFFYTTETDNGDGMALAGVNHDIALTIAQTCNLSLELTQVHGYGALQPDHTWTGMVDKLVQNELDLGIADMMITKERGSVIDFSVGIVSSEFRLFMKTTSDSYQSWTFVTVFSTRFWLCLLAFIACLTILVCLIKYHTLGGKYHDLNHIRNQHFNSL